MQICLYKSNSQAQFQFQNQNQIEFKENCNSLKLQALPMLYSPPSFPLPSCSWQLKLTLSIICSPRCRLTFNQCSQLTVQLISCQSQLSLKHRLMARNCSTEDDKQIALRITSRFSIEGVENICYTLYIALSLFLTVFVIDCVSLCCLTFWASEFNCTRSRFHWLGGALSRSSSSLELNPLFCLYVIGSQIQLNFLEILSREYMKNRRHLFAVSFCLYLLKQSKRSLFYILQHYSRHIIAFFSRGAETLMLHR